MISRNQARIESAEYLNSLSRDTLFWRFQITRTARLDGLDCLGVPVFSCVRPAARVLSVSAGKSRSWRLARAGAIAESIEFRTFENPTGEFRIGALHRGHEFPTCKDSTWTPETPIAIERVTRFSTGLDVPFPSDLVWMVRRAGGKKQFMGGSNGQALGSTFEDAFVQGLCECIERDQVTLRRISLARLGVYPPVIDMEAEIPQSIRELQARCEKASLKLYLFYCTCDIPIPTYWAMLLDPIGVPGSFSGWGCHVTHEQAAERAILEAIQSRAVFIAGARDDIERRKFQNLRTLNVKGLSEEVDQVPKIKWPSPIMNDTDELGAVLSCLGSWHDQIYYKHINLGDMHAVKTIILGLEQPMLNDWRSMRWEKLYAHHLRRTKPVQLPT